MLSMEKKSIKFLTNWVGSDWSLNNVVYYDVNNNITTNTVDAVTYTFNDNTIANIDDMAFQGSSLEFIVIPSSITNIGAGCFSFCSKLESITIPSTVTTIGGICFTDSPSLNVIYTDNISALSGVMGVNNPNSVSLITSTSDKYNGVFAKNNILPATHSDFVYTNNIDENGLSTNLTTELNNKVNKDNVRTVNVVSWDNQNVRFYGERGSVYNQGFSEFYGFPTTQVEMAVNGVTQEVVCCPNDNLVAGSYDTVSGLVREFSLEDYENLKTFGGTLSGYSMLGLDGAVNGRSGCMSVAIEKVISFAIRERISFKIIGSTVTDGESYGTISQIDPNSVFVNGVNAVQIPLNGTIPGVPAIKTGEWFSWNVKIPANYDTSTDMGFYINNELTSITLRAPELNLTGVPVNSCVAKLSSWPAILSPTAGGCYSYHTNYGLTIMNESSTKTLGNDILSISDQLFVITPEGNIPVTINVEGDIEPLKIGTVLSIVANNTPATIDINGNPMFLINGVRKTHIDVWRKLLLEGVNISSGGANYYMDILTPVIP